MVCHPSRGARLLAGLTSVSGLTSFFGVCRSLMRVRLLLSTIFCQGVHADELSVAPGGLFLPSLPGAPGAPASAPPSTQRERRYVTVPPGARC